jgi:hypothetical protein
MVLPHEPAPSLATLPQDSTLHNEVEETVRNQQGLTKSNVRHSIWKTLHRLQGYETKFALKTVIATVLLSIPAFLDESRGWWNLYESWWAVVMAWLMMHPR